jgi:hypothetical protein
MKIREFLSSEQLLQHVKVAQDHLRVRGGTGKVVIELDHKDGIFRSGHVHPQVTTGRVKVPFTPE